MSIYNPHPEVAAQVYQQITNRHAGELALFDLYWEEWKLEGKTIQLLPRFHAQFKGLV